MMIQAGVYASRLTLAPQLKPLFRPLRNPNPYPNPNPNPNLTLTQTQT
jgi:hypothetical protein